MNKILKQRKEKKMDKKVKATVALQNILSEVRSMIEISRGVICEVKSNKNKIS